MIGNYKNAAITALIVLVIVYIISKALAKRKQRRGYSEGSTVTVESSQLSSDVNYDALAQQMRNAIFGVWELPNEKTRAMEAWMSRNDEEFKHLSNIYNERFATAPETIRDHINEELFINSFKLSDFNDRLDRLGLA